MLDEHGLPVPEQSSPLPWRQFDTYEVVDANGNEVVCVVRKAFITARDCEYAVHAANWIIPCREIVRRLAEWLASDGSGGSEFDIAENAVKLWADMQRDAKGVDCETTV